MDNSSSYRFGAAVAAAGVALLGLTFVVPGPEEVAQILYLFGITAASFSAGWLRPATPLRWGVLLQAPQPVVLALFLQLTGELSRPGSSTGGAVALAIFTGLCVLLMGLTMVSAQLGAFARKVAIRAASRRVGRVPPA